MPLVIMAIVVLRCLYCTEEFIRPYKKRHAKYCSGSCRTAARNKKHAKGNRNHPLYKIWNTMRQRCNNTNAKDYPKYGGRGIKICERWNDFWAFVEDMGERPEGHSIDRIDNDGDYSPENCQWATLVEQCNNRRNNVYLTFNGQTLTVRIGKEN